MNLATFELEKSKVFVAGLLWIPISNDASKKKKESEALAREQKMDLAVWRDGNIKLVGLGSSKEGGRPGYMSAAAVISKTLEIEGQGRHSLCATQIPDGRWLYVVHRDGALTPEGDFLGSEEEVRSRFIKDYGAAEWDLIFAPDHWQVHGGIDRSFIDFLPKNDSGKVRYHRWWRIKPIGASTSLLVRTMANKALPAVLIAVVVLGGVWFAKKWQEQRSAEAAAKAAMDLIKNQPPPPPPQHPWKLKIRPEQLASDCYEAVKEAPMAPGGWTLDLVRCQDGQVTLQWARPEYAAVDSLVSVVKGASLADDANRAVAMFPLPPASNLQDEVVPILDMALLRLRVLSQRYMLGISFEQGSSAFKPLPGVQSASANNAPPNWTERKWSMSTKLNPKDVVGVLDGPGFRVDSVTLELAGGANTWKLEGTQYAQ